MKDIDTKINIGELPRSALISDKAFDELRECEINRRKSFIKLLFMGMLLIVVIIFASIAWFASNHDVRGKNMSVKIEPLPFEIRSSGAATAEYTRLFGLADSTYSEGGQVDDTDSYETGVSDKIWWRLESNDPDSYTEGFRPGASGVLDFEIVPKGNKAITVNCNFNLRAFISSENALTNVTEEIEEITESRGNDLQKKALRAIKGHILFFENRSVDSEGHEIYSGFIGADGIDIDVPYGGNVKSVTLYWKWINTFDQIFLMTTDSYYDHPLIADDNTDDRDALINFIRNDPEKFFSGISSENTLAVQSLNYTADHNNSALLSDLNDGYNTADQIIGVNLRYFLIEMAASSAVSVNS